MREHPAKNLISYAGWSVLLIYKWQWNGWSSQVCARARIWSREEKPKNIKNLLEHKDFAERFTAEEATATKTDFIVMEGAKREQTSKEYLAVKITDEGIKERS